MHDRPRDHQPLGHAAGELVDASARGVGEREPVEQGVGLTAGVGCAHAEEAAVEHQVVAHAQAAVERVVLGHDADELVHGRRLGDDVDAADPRPPRGRDHARGEHAGGGRLPRTVGAEQAHDLARRDLEAEVVDGAGAGGIDLGEVFDADH